MRWRTLLFTSVLLVLVALQSWFGGFEKDSFSGFSEENPFKTYLVFIRDWKQVFVIFLAILVPVFTLQKDLFGPKQVKALMKKAVMETIVSDVFNGDKVNTRITIFRNCGWFGICFMLFQNMISHPVVWFRGGNKIIPKFGKYLRVASRIGTENEKSTIYFFYSSKTSKECEGIASFVWQTGSEVKEENLPDISGVDLDTINLQDNSPITKRVKKYMQKGRINDVETLKRLHVRARHFYGNVLYNANSEPVGVLVIDNNQAESPFSDERIDKLGGFVKLFSPTF